MIDDLRKEFSKLASLKKAKNNEWFFKTGKGEYGEGDSFVGLTVPQCRIIAKKFNDLSFTQLKQLLHSKIHEERLIALIILVNRFRKGDPKIEKEVYEFYLANRASVNNWDLVDTSAAVIVGGYLYELKKDRKVLRRLAKSMSIWDKRIAIIATLYFIKEGEFNDTLEVSEMLLQDDHDLIHKAVGWMLREVGEQDRKVEEKFLHKHYQKMPRTMLRYAIEKFPEELRQKYLKGEV